MSIWTDGLPAWWAMAVAVAALLAGVWLGELHGRGVGRGQEREDQKARRVARQFRRIPHVPAHERRTSTAAFLHPPESASMVISGQQFTADDPIDYSQWEDGKPWHIPRPPEVAHEAWLAHTEQAMDLANGTVLAPEDQALLDELVAGLDAWRAANL